MKYLIFSIVYLILAQLNVGNLAYIWYLSAMLMNLAGIATALFGKNLNDTAQ